MASSYGVKVSPSGTSAVNGSAGAMILESGRNCLKVKSVQHTTLTISGGVGTHAIAHGLSFPPIVIAFLVYGSNLQPLPFTDSTLTDEATVYVDSTNITFGGLLSIDGTYDVYYYVSETESAD